MERCPICGGTVLKVWESKGNSWWNGEYECTSCGQTLRASGSIYNDRGISTRTLIHYHPACPKCGLDHVVAQHDPHTETISLPPSSWQCAKCETVIHHVCDTLIFASVKPLPHAKAEIPPLEMDWAFVGGAIL